MRRDDCMAAGLCPLANQPRASYNAILVGSRKDWDEYLQKHLNKVTSAFPSSVVMEEIIELSVDLGSSNFGKGQAPPAIKGFTPLNLALPVVIELASSSVQEGTAIIPAIQGFDPLILPKSTSRISKVSSSKTLEAILPSPVVINLKMFCTTPNLQTQEGVINRMPKPFPYEDIQAPYQRAMVTLFHDMMHKEIENYIDDMIAKSRIARDHLIDLRKLFECLIKYRLRLNPNKCVFKASSGKLLGLIVSQRGSKWTQQKSMPSETCRHRKLRNCIC